MAFAVSYQYMQTSGRNIHPLSQSTCYQLCPTVKKNFVSKYVRKYLCMCQAQDYSWLQLVDFVGQLQSTNIQQLLTLVPTSLTKALIDASESVRAYLLLKLSKYWVSLLHWYFLAITPVCLVWLSMLRFLMYCLACDLSWLWVRDYVVVLISDRIRKTGLSRQVPK